MVYETSYESGLRPFQPDLQRGKWEHPNDFIYACFGLALKLDLFSSSFWHFYGMGISSILPYFVYMALYLVPLMVIQSFLGQFSSSGFISAFRVSPFFKGMGYVSLALSISALFYYTLFAAIPLIFMINSLRPTLPWSCEALEQWKDLPNDTQTLCNSWNTTRKNHTADDEYLDYKSRAIHVPAVLFFSKHFNGMDFDAVGEVDFEVSWHLIGVTILFWIMVAYVFYQFSETPKFGKFIRYLVWLTVFLLMTCLLRFMFLPGSFKSVHSLTTFGFDDFSNAFATVPIYTLQAFGTGWGSFIVLSSFNNFKTNIMRYSYLIAFGQMFIFVAFGFVSFMLFQHLHGNPKSADSYTESHWIVFISSASVIATLHWPNLWTFIYYSMLLLSALIIIVTQIFSILRSLFDEFELLRQRKQEVTFGFIGILGFCSLFFCSNHGVLFYTVLSMDTLVIQTVLHLLLLLMVLWVYGRERFQRDIQFMIGQPFVAWKVWFLRYIAPLVLLGTLLAVGVVAIWEHFFSSTAVGIISILSILVPILCIPGYGIYITCQTTGSFWLRLRRACRPTDWYPVEMEDRQKYEESLGTTDITHQLYEVTEEVH